jgi:hypothetical protein
MDRLFRLISVLMISIAISSCSGFRRENQPANIEEAEIIDSTKTNEENSYSFPAPSEILEEIQGSELYFLPTVVNSLNNAKNYNNNKSRALNLGVYLSDVAYLSILNDNATCLEYLKTIQNFANDLKIYNVFEPLSNINAQDLINNKDSLSELTNGLYQDLVEQLEETDRQNILAMILMGHVTETIYLAILNIRNYKDQREAISRLFNQRIIYEQYFAYFSIYKDDPDIKQMLIETQELKLFFENLKVKKIEHKVIRDSKGNLIIKGGNEVIFNEMDFFTCKKNIIGLRERIINNKL